MRCLSRLSLGGLIFFFLGADLLSKFIFEYYLPYDQVISVIPSFVKFSYVRNYGISFGLSFPFLAWIIPIIALFSISFIYLFFRSYPSFFRGIGTALFISGALGNLVNRLYLGYVVDFISVYYQSLHFPVFNLADAFISIGGLILWLSTLSYFKRVP